MAARRGGPNLFHAECKLALEVLWKRVSDSPIDAHFDPCIREAVADLLRAPMGMSATYRFVLPTQLLAKYVAPSLDARSVQKGGDGDDSSFDARTLASHVIVPFNRLLGNPLGPAGDPYVNNPLRVPEVSAAYRVQQRDKQRWDELCRILGDVQRQNSQSVTENALSQVLIEIRRVVEETEVRYPTPQRISLETSNKLLSEFLAPRTGGRRLQAVAFALFRTLSRLWGLYDEVLSAPITAADSPGDRPADIDCRRAGATALAVEIKDRTLTLELLEDKIASARLAKVQELLFLIRATPIVSDDSVSERARSEFANGQNVYVLAAEPFVSDAMALMGETGRLGLIEEIGTVLEELSMDYADRRAWADFLKHS
jgi:hypothetical protein